MRLTVKEIAALAKLALLEEVNLTPKPGLVDRSNSGAHCDMNLATFTLSAAAVEPCFAALAAFAEQHRQRSPAQLLPDLRQIGRAGEAAMFAATGGVNTHKGALFSLGLLCAAVGYCSNAMPTAEQLCQTIAAMTAGICQRELGVAYASERSSQQKSADPPPGALGARGEAESGFASVRQYGLPFYQRLIAEGCDANEAGVHTLLHLMQQVTDTNVLSRKGQIGVALVQQRAAEICQEFSLAAVRQFDQELIALHISPGGSADLLALTLFLDRLTCKTSALTTIR